jgi:hypothetical protein
MTDNPELLRLKQKSLALASALFPHEEWIPTEANIWVAKSPLVEKYRVPERLWAENLNMDTNKAHYY